MKGTGPAFVDRRADQGVAVTRVQQSHEALEQPDFAGVLRAVVVRSLKTTLPMLNFLKTPRSSVWLVLASKSPSVVGSVPEAAVRSPGLDEARARRDA